MSPHTHNFTKILNSSLEQCERQIRFLQLRLYQDAPKEEVSIAQTRQCCSVRIPSRAWSRPSMTTGQVVHICVVVSTLWQPLPSLTGHGPTLGSRGRGSLPIFGKSQVIFNPADGEATCISAWLAWLKRWTWTSTTWGSIVEAKWSRWHMDWGHQYVICYPLALIVEEASPSCVGAPAGDSMCHIRLIE